MAKIRKNERNTKQIHPKGEFQGKIEEVQKSGLRKIGRIGEEVRLPNRNPENRLGSGVKLC